MVLGHQGLLRAGIGCIDAKPGERHRSSFALAQEAQGSSVIADTAVPLVFSSPLQRSLASSELGVEVALAWVSLDSRDLDVTRTQL